MTLVTSLARSILPTHAYRYAQRTKAALKSNWIEALPNSWLGDRVYHWFRFRRFHGRSPSRRSTMLNDYFYRVKARSVLSEPLRVRITDKEFVKDYISEKCGGDFSVPTLAVLRTPEQAIRFAYPERCVIKPTQLSGPIILRRSGEAIDLDAITSWFSLSHYFQGPREKNYRPLEPKVIVEPFIFDSADAADDFKVFCWRGQPCFVQVDLARFGAHERAYYDMDWRLLPVTRDYPRPEAGVPRPRALPVIIELARKLSEDFDFIRVDFYTRDERIAIGELTNCPESAEFRFDGNGEEVVSRLLFGPDFRR